jgi:Electron transfer DM13
VNKWKLAILALAVVLLVAWYAFRPERLFVNKRVQEAMPAAPGSSKIEAIESGIFYGVAHPTEGTATIYRMGDGGLLLRFTSFTTSNGPNVHVYLVAADEPKDSETVQRAAFIDLGPIKGNIGDQNYVLGSDVDLSKYRAVSIWCQRFRVNFGAASLTPDHRASQY